jgi:HEXXH motif-containing protein
VRGHRLTAAQFGTLAGGYGTADALAVLHAGQLSKRRLLLQATAQRSDRLPSTVRKRLDSAFDLIERVAVSAAPTAARLLRHPFLDAWATACLRRLKSPDTATPIPVDVEFGYLSGLAAAGAARAGIDFTLEIPTWDGSVLLPTLGLVDVPVSGVASVHGDRSGITVAVGDWVTHVPAPYDADRGPWRSCRTVTVTPDLVLAIDDADPYGECFRRDRVLGLAPAELDRVEASLATAWQLIERDHPDYALGIAALLTSLVPLASPEGGGSTSAASRLAAGAVSVCFPHDPAELALLLIHEVQHMKLGELLDLVDLYVEGGAPRHFAPWRADPRPVGALLQGVYAHLGVADFWRVRRRHLTGTDADRAEYEFVYWREQTSRAARTLLDSGELTPLGVRFVEELGRTLQRWREEPVGERVTDGVADLLLASTVGWRLRNYLPSDGEPARLARAWLAGGGCGAITPPDIATGSGPGSAKPPLVAELITSLLRADGGTTTADSADSAYLAGDHEVAAAGYRDSISCPGDVDHAWIGLAMALRHVRADRSAALVARPDLVRALHDELRDGGEPADPGELAAWLFPWLESTGG